MARNDAGDEKYEKVQRTRRKRMREGLIFISLLITASFGVLTMKNRHNTRQGGAGGTPKMQDRGHVFLTSESGSLRKMEQDDAFEGMAVVRKKTPAVAVAADNSASEPTEEDLVKQVEELDAKVRARKKVPGVMMEVDPEGLKLTGELQRRTRELLYKRYGFHKGFRIILEMTFPETVPDYKEKDPHGRLVFELAPIDLIPCSVFMFLEVARTFKSGAFHRNAGHVLQATVNSGVKQSMPFQEYSPEFPHKKYTTGYCGRPSGPCFYVSIQDNTGAHGPGSQQKENPHEADSLFGKVVEGTDDVVPRVHSIPAMGFLEKKFHVTFDSMTILVPSPSNENEWVPWTKPDQTNVQ